MSSALVNRFGSGIRRNNKVVTRKLVEQGKEFSVTVMASDEFIIAYQCDEGMCVNTHQATGKIIAKTTAGDIAKCNYFIVRKSGVQTVCHCGQNQRYRGREQNTCHDDRIMIKQ